MFNNSRSSGVLMHISSLPGPFGSGVLGKEALDFIDFLQECGFKNWQILPLNPIDKYNSPYKSPSAFAGNYMYIDPRSLICIGLLSKEEVESCYIKHSSNICDFENSKIKMLTLLKLAFSRTREDTINEIEKFSKHNKWLEPYALFMSVKESENGAHWWEWKNGYCDYEYCLHDYNKFTHSINFWKFVQYMFFSQWNMLKGYANSKGINIIGDIPFYVSLDSADVWSNTYYFDLNVESYKPNAVAGVPPDYFSENGQLWGNPLFNWDALKEEGYCWWIDRFKFLNRNFDMIRIDHFRAFSSYWAIPYGAKTARNGRWLKGPSRDFFNTLHDKLPDINLVAEDLGDIDDDVRDLLSYTDLPGMKVMEFGLEDIPNSIHLPHNFDENFVAYLGTHDCNTFLGFLKSLPEEKRTATLKYIGFYGDNWQKEGCENKACRCAIESLWRSNAFLSIVSIQDMCGLGEKHRMNIPGIKKDNWNFRITKYQLENIDKGYYTRINEMFNR